MGYTISLPKFVKLRMANVFLHLDTEFYMPNLFGYRYRMKFSFPQKYETSIEGRMAVVGPRKNANVGQAILSQK